MEPTEDRSEAGGAEPASGPGRPPNPRGRSRLIALLLILVAAAGGYFGWHRYAATIASPNLATATPQTPPTVTVSTPIAKDIVEWDEYTGQFVALESVEVRARVSGYLESIHFEDGQLVHAGDLLFVIDPRPFEIALASAKAQLEQAQAGYDLAVAQLKRAETLRQSDFASVATYDERVQQSRAAAATINVAKAAVAAAELDLEFTHITAPIGGRISAHAVSVGNLIAGGSGNGTTLLTTIVSLDPIQLLFDISEANLLAYQRAIAEGRLTSVRDGSVEIQAQLMDEPGWSLKGHIDFVDNQVDRTAGTIRVRAVLPNPDFLITAGQFGRVRIPGSDRYRALLVPEAAIVTDQARKLVYVVSDDGTVVAKVVRLGPNRGPQLRIIREGLEPTDRIIIDGLLRARPGAKVTAEPGKIDLPDPEE